MIISIDLYVYMSFTDLTYKQYNAIHVMIV